MDPGILERSLTGIQLTARIPAILQESAKQGNIALQIFHLIPSCLAEEKAEGFSSNTGA